MRSSGAEPGITGEAGKVQTLAEQTMTDPSLRFLAGEGEMRRRIREFDWSTTELGDPTGWSNGLKTTMMTMLNCGAPSYLAWGPSFVQFYNDAYIGLLGEKKHPQALGITTSETWNEIWDFVGPAFNSIMASGRALAEVDKRLPMQRNGYLEECYFTFSYSPLLDDDYQVNGVLVQAWETTSEFVSYRRANVVRMLVQGLSEATDMAGIRDAFGRSVRENRQDLPFGLWYEIREDRSGLDLVAAAGIERGSALSPECIDLRHGSRYQGLMNVDRPVLHNCLFAPALLRWEPGEPPPANPQSMMIKPLCYSTYQHPDSYLVLAVNPMRPDDAAQQDFLQLIRMHLENAVRRINTVELERREYEHRFNSIMSVMPCLVWMSDAGGSFTFVNQTWVEFTGITPAQAMGSGWTAAMHPDDLDSVHSLHAARVRTTLNREYRLRHANGAYRWMLDKASPRYGIHGEFLGYTGTCIDITDRKEAEQRIIASQAELRDLYDRLQHVREEERCALAREVHDQLGQVLSAAKIDIKLLEEGVRSDATRLSRENIVTELQSASSSLERAIQVVRRLATELRPPELESQGLSAAIQWHALDFERRTKIRCNVWFESDMPQPTDAGAVALFRIFQESMTNILRHANATEVWISLGCRGNRVLLRVRDNGVGIRRHSAQSGRSMGLKGMRERAGIAGGRLVVGRLPSGGTLVAASLPLLAGSFLHEENK
jgi:PAS domain S-box-containing protein